MKLKSEIRILLADDHPMMLEGLSSGLLRAGYQLITTVSNGKEVLIHVKNNTYDVLILDVEMPFHNGYEVVEKMQTLGIETPVIFLSYHKEKKYLALAKKLGVSAYMLKEDGIALLNECIVHTLKGRTFYSPSFDKNFHSELTLEFSVLDELTRSEKVILTWISKGLSSTEVAQTLKVSKKTIQNHRFNITQKLKYLIPDFDLSEWAIENRLLIERL